VQPLFYFSTFFKELFMEWTKKPLSKGIKSLYGLADLGFGLRTQFSMYYYMFFLINIAKYPPAVVATITSITTAANAILSPTYGGIISGMKPMRWGRNRSWMLIMPPLTLIAVNLQWSRVSSNVFLSAGVIIAAFFIGTLGTQIAWVANLNLIPTLANNPAERGMLSSHRMMYTSAAAMIVGYIGPLFVVFFTSLLGSPNSAYPFTMLTMSVLYVITYLIIFAITKGYEPTGAEEAAMAAATTSAATDKGAEKQKTGVGVMLESIYKNPHLIALLLGTFCRSLANFMYTAVIAFYFTYVAKNMAMMAHYVFISSLASFLGASIAGPLNKKFSNRTLSIIGLAIAGGTMVLGKYTGLNMWMVFICSIINRLASGSLGSWNVPMYSEAAIYSEWKTGRNATAFIMGLQNTPLQIANLTRNMIIPLFLAALGFVSGMSVDLATPQIQQGILTLLMLIPGISYLVNGLLILVGYRLNNENTAQYQKEINDRKAAAPAAAS
jgi:GPH family glycoside/pentoside/hexuronide:cation symporter